MIFIILIYLAHYFTTHRTNNKYKKRTDELGKRKREIEEHRLVREVGSSSRTEINQCVVSALTELLPPNFPRKAFKSVPPRCQMTIS